MWWFQYISVRLPPGFCWSLRGTAWTWCLYLLCRTRYSDGLQWDPAPSTQHSASSPWHAHRIALRPQLPPPPRPCLLLQSKQTQADVKTKGKGSLRTSMCDSVVLNCFWTVREHIPRWNRYLKCIEQNTMWNICLWERQRQPWFSRMTDEWISGTIKKEATLQPKLWWELSHKALLLLYSNHSTVTVDFCSRSSIIIIRRLSSIRSNFIYIVPNHMALCHKEQL